MAVSLRYNTGHMPWTHTPEERDNDLCLCWCGGLGAMIIAASAQTPELVYCAARRGQVFGAEDGGKSWQTYALPAEGIYALACI